MLLDLPPVDVDRVSTPCSETTNSADLAAVAAGCSESQGVVSSPKIG